jgi:hypothetical protein
MKWFILFAMIEMRVIGVTQKENLRLELKRTNALLINLSMLNIGITGF